MKMYTECRKSQLEKNRGKKSRVEEGKSKVWQRWEKWDKGGLKYGRDARRRFNKWKSNIWQ